MVEQGLSGQTLGGKYLLGKLLGKGGFAEVYQAENTVLKRPQAIKVLLEQHQSNPKFRERFIREAQTLAALDHPNIVPIHDFGFEGNRGYLVMPYLSGGTLQALLPQRQGLLSLDDTLRVLKPICAALDYAHAKNVVHLDLKPLNVLRHEDGRLLLSDFGLGHFMNQEVVEGKSSLLLGTPHYMAPEHALGRPEQRSDIYSLGVIAYRLLTGHVPFDGPTPLAILIKQRSEPPPPLRALVPALPETVEQVVLTALAKDPQQRFASAQAFANALEQAGKTAASSASMTAPMTPTNIMTPTSVPFPPTVGRTLAATGAPLPGTTLLRFAGMAGPPFVWSPDGMRIASNGDRGVIVWDAQTGAVLRTYHGHDDNTVAVLAWSPNGAYIASFSPRAMLHYTNSGRYIGILIWGASGKEMQASDHDNHEERRLLFWKVKDRPKETIGTHDREQSVLLGAYGNNIVWSPDESRIALADGNNLAIWSMRGALLFHSIRCTQAMAWSPDGTRIACSDKHEISVWDVRNPPAGAEGGQARHLLTYRGHSRYGEHFVYALAWNPNGREIVSKSTDGSVQVWDSSSGQTRSSSSLPMPINLPKYRPPNLMQYMQGNPKEGVISPDGTRLALASDQGVLVRDATTDTPLFTYRGYFEGNTAQFWNPELTFLAWSPDGQKIVSQSADRRVHVWQAG
jgi:WD40 repeat protein/tRNA A-37 threonylcarbamoyl transferase component Bud32